MPTFHRFVYYTRYQVYDNLALVPVFSTQRTRLHITHKYFGPEGNPNDATF